MITFNLEKILKERGIKKIQFAEMVGVRPSTVSGWVRSGLTSISFDSLDKIAQVLEIDDIRELILYERNEK